MTIDYSGKRIGKLTVTTDVECRRDFGGRSRRFWRCICDCGVETWRDASSMGGKTFLACMNCKGKTHGASYSPTYRIWANMLSRCRDKNNGGYYLYGGRGVKVCNRWLKFENFLADMGDRPKGKSIERRNTNGNYMPKNCYWATPKQQGQNRRTNVLSFEKAIEIRKLYAAGKTKTQIAQRFGVSFPAVARVLDGSRWTYP